MFPFPFTCFTNSFLLNNQESIDELEKIVVPLFGKIINRNVTPLWIELHPYSQNFCQKMIKIVPFRDTRKLNIFFPLPDIQQHQIKCNVIKLLLKFYEKLTM